ncbi:DUF7167 family protein [Paenibacillus senegalensis]|uniref:DUF7167 family protein n=1 Tax=Paenibacillus senegalensis TaxID=1465766 RepID=UPI0002888075|nr:hypothetical protein [Paenibacillus senegalensis]
MKIKIVMDVQNYQIEDVLELDDDKLEPLTEDELRAAVEINIREWANNQIQIAWEVLESEEE